jgi:hypothetical protein
MNRFWKLLNWEINRFGKIYVVLLLMTLVLQFVGVITYSLRFMNKVNKIMDDGYLSLSQYVQNFGKITFENYTYNSFIFMAPIALGGVTLLLYVFVIWYKEWFGTNTFIYRLLMLPTSRINVYMAKLTAIILFVLGLVAFQYFILPLQMLTFNAIINNELRDSISIVGMMDRSPYLHYLFPPLFIEFLFYYSLGVTAIIVFFTLILLERSFQFKGILAGAAYGSSMVFLILLPLQITTRWIKNYFYPSEIFLSIVIVMILIAIGSLWFSAFLLNKKVTV